MKIHVLQHVPFENLGSIEPWLTSHNLTFVTSRLYEKPTLPGLDDFDLLIVLGGPMSVHDHAFHPWLVPETRLIADAVAAGKSILGICLGAQLLAHALSGRVHPNPHREIGWWPIAPSISLPAIPALAEIFPEPLDVFHWHGETFDLPPDATHLARSTACVNQAFALTPKILGLQFHLETTPRSAASLLKHAASDLTPGPYVQTPEQILASPEKFHRINTLMDRLLTHLTT